MLPANGMVETGRGVVGTVLGGGTDVVVVARVVPDVGGMVVGVNVTVVVVALMVLGLDGTVVVVVNSGWETTTTPAIPTPPGPPWIVQ
jgi:hypothetical protein